MKFNSILEIGCGSGGIIKPFNDIGIPCNIDYDKDFLVEINFYYFMETIKSKMKSVIC